VNFDDTARARGNGRIVGDKDDRLSRGMERIEHLQNHASGRGIQVACGFIAKNDAWVVHKSTGYGNALALAAAELRRAIREALAETDIACGLLGTGETLGTDETPA
jgi:hypothetical protein